MVRIHLDTDLGGDIDDLQALAYLLASPDVEITGITTAAEQGGRRAGYVRRALELAGRLDIPVAAGVDVSSGRFRSIPDYPPELAYWGQPVPPAPGPPEQALALVRRSLDAGATLVAIGPYTNLAVVEEAEPGRLANADVVLMGTSFIPSRPGYPLLGPEMDYNVQLDVAAARTVLSACTPLLVPLGPCLETAIRRAHLPRLLAAGPLAQLLAQQAEAFDAEWHNAERHGDLAPQLPPDFINFLYDPLACAIAIGWRQGVRIDSLRLVHELIDGWLVQRIDPRGRPANVVVSLDGAAFSQAWLERVAAPRSASPRSPGGRSRRPAGSARLPHH